MGARETALTVLIACRKDGGWSNSALKDQIFQDRLDRRDAALATRLCYGVLQNRGKLDFYLQQLLTGKLKDLHPLIHDILHLGLYQLLEMDKIPESAVVNTSVDLAKKFCKKQRFAPGLVNGVLRNGIRSKDSLKAPTRLEDVYSHPKALIQLLREYVGEPSLEPMLRANNDTPSTVAQVNTLRITAAALAQRLEAEGVQVQPHGWMKNSLVLSNTGALEQLPAFKEGLFYVQDAAAKLSVLCAQLTPGQNVLDCCAAPGGKSFAAAIEMENRGHITSCDVHPHKIDIIRSGAQRLGLDAMTARLQDATENVDQWVGQMDTVICDVPCSGLGIIRKKPDIRYKNLREMEALPALQLQILKNQASYVRPGGLLLYSTCTLLRRENEGVVEAFLEENKSFTLEPLPLPENFPENRSGMLALVPGQYDTDGFFIARLRRTK